MAPFAPRDIFDHFVGHFIGTIAILIPHIEGIVTVAIQRRALRLTRHAGTERPEADTSRNPQAPTATVERPV